MTFGNMRINAMRRIKLMIIFLILSVIISGCFKEKQATDYSSVDTLMPSEEVVDSKKGEPQDFPDITAGAGHSCLLTTTGRVECWGANQFSQLGAKTGPFTSLEGRSPVQEGIPGDWVKANVRGLSGKVTAIRSGYYHTCALLGEGGIQCWGQNTSGQLGDGTTANKDIAVSVMGLDIPITAISLGAVHTCALLETGDVRCWGNNENYQLGNGTNQNSSLPVDVAELPDRIVQVAAGGVFTCALTHNGKLYCWGDGSNGRFGDSSKEIYQTPILVNELEQDIDLIVAGDYHLCARTSSGKIFCWGALSSDKGFSAQQPLILEELTGTVVQMTAGGGYTCALTSADCVKCWGDNSFGQLGDGTVIGSWVPLDAIGVSDNVLSIASGSGHVCALLMEGGVHCWGDCSFGQCGDSTLQWAWSTYTNHKYNFSVDYPSWNVMEIPNPDYPAEIDQVWFATSSFPSAQTDARADITLWITQENPTPKWNADFFDNYKVEEIWLGNVSALRITGINKESRRDEYVIIVQTGDYFIQAMPNQSTESQRYFDPIMYSLNINWDLVTVPAVVP
jgi:alpha-tubulin suppressor-like RCC1 family protein